MKKSRLITLLAVPLVSSILFTSPFNATNQEEILQAINVYCIGSPLSDPKNYVLVQTKNKEGNFGYTIDLSNLNETDEDNYIKGLIKKIGQPITVNASKNIPNYKKINLEEADFRASKDNEGLVFFVNIRNANQNLQEIEENLKQIYGKNIHLNKKANPEETINLYNSYLKPKSVQ